MQLRLESLDIRNPDAAETTIFVVNDMQTVTRPASLVPKVTSIGRSAQKQISGSSQ